MLAFYSVKAFSTVEVLAPYLLLRPPKRRLIGEAESSNLLLGWFFSDGLDCGESVELRLLLEVVVRV